MKYFVVALFTVSLLSLCFLSLNYIWTWFSIDYNIFAKVIVSMLVFLLAVTGLIMIFSGAFAKNPNHPIVGKK